jgi:hypothetical protein
MSPEKLLNELKTHNSEQYKIVSSLRNLVLKDKNTSEEVKYGGFYYSKEKPYMGIFVSKNHVSMEFSNGAQFDDQDKLLQGSGKQRRHLKFSSMEDISKTAINSFLKQARGV